jgi:hypothetical protein
MATRYNKTHANDSEGQNYITLIAFQESSFQSLQTFLTACSILNMSKSSFFMPETRKYIREFEREFRSSYISVS